jgi:predicted enzyme related to lactoylglutathione lyase
MVEIDSLTVGIPVPDSPAGSADVLRLGVPDLEGVQRRVVSLGADPTAIRTVPGVVRCFDFRDPFGNRLSFYQVLQG